MEEGFTSKTLRREPEKIWDEKEILKRLSDKTEFERAVLMATLRIPRGKVTTYKRIAEMVGRPRACRAVGNALHKNPLAPIIPCHRVVRSDGTLAGEEGCVEARRLRLLEEGIRVEGNRVKLSRDILF
ncbi:MAG: Methylated-DNA/protein-cysteinemethyltransferase [Candidatus Bathyarchaeota archaeon B63]|nr:MAG: Methylated-DNA/protein-cysteinemethyltransferase [Candidatus Bathyarchaeota archaeon B63]